MLQYSESTKGYVWKVNLSAGQATGLEIAFMKIHLTNILRNIAVLHIFF